MRNKTEAARVNYVFLTCHIIYQAIILIAYMAESIKGTRTWMYFLPLAVIIAATIIIETCIYKKDNEAVIMRHMAAIGFAFMYMYVLYTAANPLIFVYAVPMLVLVTMYCDMKYCALLGSGMIIINIIDAVRRYFDGGYQGQEMEEIEIQILVLVLYFAYTYVCSMVQQMNSQEKLDNIKEDEKRVQQLLSTVMAISEDMNGAIKKISSSTDALNQSSEETMSAMSEVSGGALKQLNRYSHS